MQAYKLKGKIDDAGNLIIAEPVKMPPGDVEVIVLQAVESASSTDTETESQAQTPKRKSKVKSLKELLENAPPIPPDFDPEQARWEGLKEKYDL
ncbi:MAG: hypothetical protein KME54_23530 [Tolypothrix brevis GSE-NOS-MK-07-07A]|jgi:hypothetical protein|nr:hypothetical protein [Tolypothrix brevis GSE-NOS-MK-07-07A]